MECEDATAHIAAYLAGSLPRRRGRGASSPCGGVRRMPRHADEDVAAAGTNPSCGVRRGACRLQGWARRPSAKHSPASRCATCHFSGQSCSWICRRRFVSDRAVCTTCDQPRSSHRRLMADSRSPDASLHTKADAPSAKDRAPDLWIVHSREHDHFYLGVRLRDLTAGLQSVDVLEVHVEYIHVRLESSGCLQQCSAVGDASQPSSPVPATGRRLSLRRGGRPQVTRGVASTTLTSMDGVRERAFEHIRNP